VNPLTRWWNAARRPHVVLSIGLLLAIAWAVPAEAGRRGRKSKKKRARAEQAERARREQPAPAPAPAVNGDGAAGSRDRLAKGESKTGDRAAAQPREKVFDFSGFELAGSERMPQLLYFLDRAEQELERASLERRSFVPEMIRSLDEEDL